MNNAAVSLKYTKDGQILVPSSVHARLAWSEANRKKANDEKALQDEHERQRQEAREALNKKVGLRRSASAGKVQASRESLLAANRVQRLLELKDLVAQTVGLQIERANAGVGRPRQFVDILLILLALLL